MSTFEPAALTLEALRARGEPDFFERDTRVWKSKLVAWFQTETQRTLYPDQTEMFLIEMLAYALSLKAESGQAAVLQNIAVWAEGRHLQELGANVGILKLLAQKATVTLRFSLREARLVPSLIPAGTRVAAGALEFATVADLIIAAGQLSADTLARATVAGKTHNDLMVGQISTVADALPFIVSVQNVTVSGGGSDDETEDRLREVIVDAPEAFDRRGGWGGYGLFVRRVNPAIADVAVHRPEPGHIEIYFVVDGDAVPGGDLRDQVLAALEPDTVVPMGDFVSVLPPAPVDFEIVLYLRVDPNMALAGIEAQVDAAVRARFTKFRRPLLSGDRQTQFSPESGKLGAQVAASPIEAAALTVPGVLDAEATGIAWQDLPFNQYPRLAGLAIIPESAVDD